MKLQQLIYAVKVAECGNITEASRRLFVSQPRWGLPSLSALTRAWW